MHSRKFRPIIIVVVVALVTVGVVCLLQNRSVQQINNPQKDLGGEVRTLMPHGYVIGDELFFSPLLGLSFTGQLATLKFENNKFTEQEMPGVLEVFQKKSGQDVLDAIRAIVKKEARNPDDCDFDVTEPNIGNAVVKIKPKKAYEPTEQELFEVAKKLMPELKTLVDYKKYCDQNLECAWDKEALIQAYQQKTCSAYAVSNHYHDESYFQFATEANGSDTFVYVHYDVNGGDRSWIGHVDLLVNY